MYTKKNLYGWRLQSSKGVSRLSSWFIDRHFLFVYVVYGKVIEK